jgi:DNA segregation ATPase FtsK/SpoIIIE, S-DNA-T family
VAELGTSPRMDTEPWHLPVGVRESDLEAAEIDVYEGEHVMITGQARSGKSTLLLAIAESVRGTGVTVWGVCGRRSPLPQAKLDRYAVGEEDAAALLAAARVHRGPLVLLVDDAEQFADNDQAFAGLLSARTTDLLVIAAGRSDDLRSLYSHWTKTIRKARCGVLLQPNVDYDGELLGVNLPRRAPVALTAGRGYVVFGGTVDLLQAMSPSDEAA